MVLTGQIWHGTIEFALVHLFEHELDLSALNARFRNDETGASAYDPRVMLKIGYLSPCRTNQPQSANPRSTTYTDRIPVPVP
jgi:hypothetical protein